MKLPSSNLVIYNSGNQMLESTAYFRFPPLLEVFPEKSCSDVIREEKNEMIYFKNKKHIIAFQIPRKYK